MSPKTPLDQNFDVLAEGFRVLQLEGEAILKCAERIKVDPQFKKSVELLRDSLTRGGKIVVMGVGKSGKVAQKIVATLCSTGSLAVFLHPTEGLHGDLGMVGPQDSVLALSFTGNTEELVRLLPSIRNLKVPVIGISGNRQSKLGALCDAWVDGFVETEACPHNLAPTSSTTLALALGDAIAMALMRIRGFRPEDFAQNHPGGSLGRKLHLKVSEVMHAQVPVLGESASMDEVVVASTQGKLGAVLIVEITKLIGIITDGDIRRALQHREKFFTLKAGEVMTRGPVTAREDMMAKAALDLMENRPSQISVLPVVDQQNNWKGLIRLHDLVREF